MIRRALPAVALASACSLAFVEPRPDLVVAGAPPPRCTETYWLPAADFAAIAALWTGAVLVHLDARDDCAGGERNCAQLGLEFVLPALASIPLGISAYRGRAAIADCRAAIAWQRQAAVPPASGTIGHACTPVFDAPERCDRGYCVNGSCQAEPPLAATRRLCARALAALRRAPTPEARAALFRTLPPACRPLVPDR
jgi:hypothetical protein